MAYKPVNFNRGSVIVDLQDEVASLQDVLKNYKRENTKLREELAKPQPGPEPGGEKQALQEAKGRIADLLNDIRDTQTNLDTARRQISKLNNINDNYQKNFAAGNKENTQLRNRIANQIKKDKQGKQLIQNLTDKLDKEKVQGQQLAAKLISKEKKIQKVANTLQGAQKAVKQIANERKDIAQIIASNLRASGIEVDIDPETGNITLRMDESFYFRNDSYELSERAQEKLSRIMPIYAKSLLGNPIIAKRIDGITITGFASPKYFRKFVDPYKTKGEAYEYNLELSVNRAKQIVEFMAGDKIKEFPYKLSTTQTTQRVWKRFYGPH